ncbi:hypothetical protein Bca4012_004769 [Brassica carinata]
MWPQINFFFLFPYLVLQQFHRKITSLFSSTMQHLYFSLSVLQIPSLLKFNSSTIEISIKPTLNNIS